MSDQPARVITPTTVPVAQLGSVGLSYGAARALESVSIDEAFLDLSGTDRLHHGSPALTLDDVRIDAARLDGGAARVP